MEDKRFKLVETLYNRRKIIDARLGTIEVTEIETGEGNDYSINCFIPTWRLLDILNDFEDRLSKIESKLNS